MIVVRRRRQPEQTRDMDEVAHSLSQISYALGGSEYVETDDDDIIRWSNHPFGYFNVSEED